MPASTTMDMPQQREENKRAYIYICLAATVPLHEDPFHIQPFTNIKEEELRDKRYQSKIKDSKTLPHKHKRETSSHPTKPNPTQHPNKKRKPKKKNVPRNLQSPHIPHPSRFHTHLRSISSHSRPLRVSFHPSHHNIPPPPSLTIPPLLASHLLTHIHIYSLKFGTVASKSIEGRFRAFDDRARDSLPVEERRHRFQRMREGREI